MEIIKCIVIILLLIHIYNTNDSTKILVYWFYIPGCPHCDNMKNNWFTMKKKLPPKYKLIEIDTSLKKNESLATEFNVNGVPHIVKINPDNTKSVYNGDRTVDNMIMWIKS